MKASGEGGRVLANGILSAATIGRWRIEPGEDLDQQALTIDALSDVNEFYLDYPKLGVELRLGRLSLVWTPDQVTRITRESWRLRGEAVVKESV